jgi:hypothetical protein
MSSNDSERLICFTKMTILPDFGPPATTTLFDLDDVAAIYLYINQPSLLSAARKKFA